MHAGFIGLGAMGMNMARNVAKAGFLQTVYNRTADKAAQLAEELQITASSSPAQLAAQCDIVLICVSADADVLEMVNAIAPSLQPGSIVVDTSTVSIETARQAATILSKHQCRFIDAPVSGGVEGASKGTLAMMAGGDTKALETARPVLESMTARIVHMGECGAGQATKAVNQIMAAGINQAVCEALAFGQKQGLAMDNVIDVISGGAAGNWFLQHRGPTMTQNIYKPGFKVALHQKDLAICREMAAKCGIETPLVDKTLEDYAELINKGFGDEDISALYRLKSHQ